MKGIQEKRYANKKKQNMLVGVHGFEERKRLIARALAYRKTM